MSRRASAFVLVVGVVLGSGCFSYSPTSGRPRTVDAPTNPPAWPDWNAAALEPIKAATPERLFRARMQPGKTLDELKSDDLKSLVVTPDYTVLRNEVIEGELIRVFRQPEIGWRGLDLIFTGFIPTGDALSPADVEANSWKLGRWRAARLRESINSSWRAQGLEPDPTRDEAGFGDGIPFHIPDELPMNCCGIVLHLWAMGGNDYERAVMQELTSRGWLVVDIKPTHVAPAELTADAMAKIMVLEQEQDTLNSQIPQAEDGETWRAYTKRLEKSPAHHRQIAISGEITNLRNPVIPLCDDADVSSAAMIVAQRIDASFARNSAASRAILETARRMHPALRGKPVVVMGFSAGALSTPTVAARLIPDVDAVVIIGGAANALGVATHSVISKGGIRLKCGDKAPTAQTVRALEKEYLNRSRLDAYQTAPLLVDRPVLVIDAGLDTWVPSEYGQILYERLGRPDRLHMPLGGHGFLFYFLPGRAEWIADWVGKAVNGERNAKKE